MSSMTREPATALPTPDEFAAATRGDADAARRVVRVLHPVVVRYCRARLGTAAAEDAATEIGHRLLALLRGRERGGPALAYRVAREVTDARTPPDAPVPSAPPRRLRLVTASRAAMPTVLALLPAELREVLVLRVAAGLGVADVAALLDLTVDTVRVTQHRAIARLRALTADPGVA